jgi:hypothetical protein
MTQTGHRGTAINAQLLVRGVGSRWIATAGLKKVQWTSVFPVDCSAVKGSSSGGRADVGGLSLKSLAGFAAPCGRLDVVAEAVAQTPQTFRLTCRGGNGRPG